MTDNQIQTEALAIICSRFLHMKEITPRRLLVSKFQVPNAISELVKKGFVRQVATSTNEELYLPRAAAFAFADDAQFAESAKNAATMVLHLLRNIYEVELGKESFSYDDVLRHAQKTFGVVEPDSVKFGLYLCQDFNVFAHWASNASREITNFGLAERVILIKPEEEWGAYIYRTLHPEYNLALPQVTEHRCSECESRSADSSNNERLLDLKPSLYGITLNVNALLQRLSSAWKAASNGLRVVILALIAITVCGVWIAIVWRLCNEFSSIITINLRCPTIRLQLQNPQATDTLIRPRG